MCSYLDKLTGLWGLYWLGKSSGWTNPLLSHVPTDSHRCAIYTPAGKMVWIKCNMPMQLDFGRPLRYAHWTPHIIIEPLNEEKVYDLLSLSPFSLIDFYIERVDNSIKVRKREAEGLGDEIRETELEGSAKIAKEISKELCDIRVKLYDSYLVLSKGLITLSTPLSQSTYISELRDLLVIFGEKGENVTIDCRNSSIWTKGLAHADIYFELTPSRASWLQPFARVWDFLAYDDEIASPFIEIPMRDKKLILFSSKPILVRFSKERRMASISLRGPTQIIESEFLNDLTYVGRWASFCLKEGTNKRIPRLRIRPDVLVPYRTVLKEIDRGLWKVTIELSNPHENGIGTTLTVEKPYYIKDAFSNGERLELSWLNLLEIYLSPYSAMTLELYLKEKKIFVK